MGSWRMMRGHARTAAQKRHVPLSLEASIHLDSTLPSSDDDDTDGDEQRQRQSGRPKNRLSESAHPPTHLPISRSQARYGAALDFNQTATNTFRLFHDVDEKVQVLFPMYLLCSSGKSRSSFEACDR